MHFRFGCDCYLSQSDNICNCDRSLPQSYVLCCIVLVTNGQRERAATSGKAAHLGVARSCDRNAVKFARIARTIARNSTTLWIAIAGIHSSLGNACASAYSFTVARSKSRIRSQLFTIEVNVFCFLVPLRARCSIHRFTMSTLVAAKAQTIGVRSDWRHREEGLHGRLACIGVYRGACCSCDGLSPTPQRPRIA